MLRLLVALVAATTLAATAAAAPPPDENRLPTRRGPSEASRREPDYTQAAARLTHGRTTDVYCWSAFDWQRLTRSGYVDIWGFVRRDRPRRINLASHTCANLDRMHYSGGAFPFDPDPLMALAVNALAHEAVHTEGVYDEAVAQCYAMQRTTQLAVLLGKSRSFGRELARLVWVHYGDFPRRYRSSACHDGGRLDLRPRSHVWP